VTRSLEEWLPKASAAGITSVFDAGMLLIGEEKRVPDLHASRT